MTLIILIIIIIIIIINNHVSTLLINNSYTIRAPSNPNSLWQSKHKRRIKTYN